MDEETRQKSPAYNLGKVAVYAENPHLRAAARKLRAAAASSAASSACEQLLASASSSCSHRKQQPPGGFSGRPAARPPSVNEQNYTTLQTPYRLQRNSDNIYNMASTLRSRDPVARSDVPQTRGNGARWPHEVIRKPRRRPFDARSRGCSAVAPGNRFSRERSSEVAVRAASELRANSRAVPRHHAQNERLRHAPALRRSLSDAHLPAIAQAPLTLDGARRHTTTAERNALSKIYYAVVASPNPVLRGRLSSSGTSSQRRHLVPT